MMATRCSGPDDGRIAVLGAGPAGMSAALWLKHLGFSPVVIETARQAGGMQQLNFLRNEWVLGQPGLTGPELGAKFAEHMAAERIPIEFGCSPISIEPAGRQFAIALRTSDNETLATTFRAVLIATGLRYRAQEVLEAVPGFGDLGADDIVYGPYAFLGMEKLAGESVLIVGCGDNAYENAHFLLEAGARVALVCRSLPRAQTRLREAVQAFVSKYALLTHARIESLRRGDDCIEVSLLSASKAETLRVRKIHVLAGYAPNTLFLETALSPSLGHLELDSAGYLKVDGWGRTSIPGIYAAGDVCNPDFPNVASAIASGAKAAKAVEIDLRNCP
ncbi:MAG: NAD(P)/FAD-dependent oxidoreductase [Rhodocyclaceae bacterium]|nr:NAD(P)/FAD-dependent oxidoreductase [Rhodocyclaceae bacterium]